MAQSPERARAWYEANRARLNLMKRARYEANREKVLGQQRDFAKKNPDVVKKRQRASYLKRNYGMSMPAYEKMLDEQGHACLLCKSLSPFRKDGFFVVDHCHLYGTVRGLLCQHCNTGLGHFKDSPAVLRAAAEYLENNTCQS